MSTADRGMTVLLCGANGLIGQRLAERLTARGHTVLRGVRQVRLATDVAIDYQRDTTPAAWLPRLVGVDAVINAVGIIREHAPGDFQRIHTDAPTALFQACAERGIRRVIQLSALGAETRATPYLASKYAADEALRAAVPRGIVVRPSLVFAPDGVSARFFLTLAASPLLLLPGRAEPRVQPLHSDDLTELLATLLERDDYAGRCVAAVGGRALSLRELLATYRAAQGFPPALAITTPAALWTWPARLAELHRRSLLTRDTLRMMQAGNAAPVADMAALLGRLPRAPEDFLTTTEQAITRAASLRRWRAGLFRGSLALLWLVSGLLPLLHPAPGLHLLAEQGLTGTLAGVVQGGAALCDVLLGVLTLWRPGRRLWLAQMGLIGVYTVLIVWGWTYLLLDPFAPVIKNLPILALLFSLYLDEERP